MFFKPKREKWHISECDCLVTTRPPLLYFSIIYNEIKLKSHMVSKYFCFWMYLAVLGKVYWIFNAFHIILYWGFGSVHNVVFKRVQMPLQVFSRWKLMCSKCLLCKIGIFQILSSLFRWIYVIEQAGLCRYQGCML